MSQDQKKEKSIVIPDETLTEEGKPRPDGAGTTVVIKGDDDDDQK